MCCYLPVFLCLFESFRRNLNEATAVYISEYYLVCHFVIMTLRLSRKFLARGEIHRFHNGRALIVNGVDRDLRRNRSVLITKRQAR